MYDFDSSHSTVEFSVKHMMIATVKGRFNSFKGTLHIDEQNPAASEVDVTIDVSSIDTGADGRDSHLRSPDFFDVAQFPTITFKSTKIEALSDEKYRVTGDLTIHGVTRPQTLEVTREGSVKDMQGKQRHAFSVTGKLSRKDFGLEWNVALESGGWLVGDEIKIAIEAEVIEAVPVAA